MLSLSQQNFEAYKSPATPDPWLLRDGFCRKNSLGRGRSPPPSPQQAPVEDQMNWLSAGRERPDAPCPPQSHPDSLLLHHSATGGRVFRPPEHQFPFYGQQRAYGSGFYLPVPQYVQSPVPATRSEQFFPSAVGATTDQTQRLSFSEDTPTSVASDISANLSRMVPSPAAEDMRVSTRGGPYKVPSGKEGSLKHRLLRPPDIHIVEPPAGVVADAPLSAPPLHHSRQPRAPTYFAKGSVIQLANGLLKRVEDLCTEDFLQSAELSSDLRIDSSTVLRIEPSSKTAFIQFSVGHNKVQVSVEAAVEHPFFVFNRGWSSCCPERSLQRYGLNCHKLSVGNVCISLTHKDSSRAKKPPAQRKRRSSAPS